MKKIFLVLEEDIFEGVLGDVQGMNSFITKGVFDSEEGANKALESLKPFINMEFTDGSFWERTCIMREMELNKLETNF